MKSKESVLKCPSCSEILPALANVCPSCNYVIAARNEGEAITLQELVYRIENTLAELKALPHPSAINLIRKNILGLCIYLGFILAFTAYVLHLRYYYADTYGPVIGVAAALIVLPLVVMIIKNSDKNQSEKFAMQNGINILENRKNAEKSFKELKADFEKSKRLAKIFFGEDQKVKLLLEELNDEISREEVKVINANKSIKFLYIVLGLLLLLPLLIPKN